MYIYKVIEMDKIREIDMFGKLEGMLVLFNKISMEVNVNYLFIINVGFISFFLFSQFILHCNAL